MSRVSCDLLVLGAKCETVVIFGLLEVGRNCFLTTSLSNPTQTPTQELILTMI